MLKMHIGKNIRKYRERCGLTQEDLSKLLNVSKGTISSWEVDRTEPRMGMVEQMASIFGCTKSELVGIQTETINDAEFFIMYSQLDAREKAIVSQLVKSMVDSHSDK